MNVAVRGHGTWCVAKKGAITVRLAPEMIFEWPALEQIPFKERRTPGARLLTPPAKRRFKNEQTRLGTFGKATGGGQFQTPQNGIIMQSGINVLMLIAVFLVGMGIGDIVSKTNQANTHYAALISYPNGQE
jgi:hypothetical protein